MSYRYSAFTAAILAVASQIFISAAHAQTYSNTTPINIPTAGFATPYPSSITVSGAPTSIGYLSVTLNGFFHNWVNNVNVLLVSPSGQQILLMANCNGGGDASNNTLTFIPDGTATLPNVNTNVVSGVYACSVYNTSNLPAPAPSGPYGTSLAPLLGTNANGNWSLFVYDNFPGDSGSFAGGWSISFNQTTPLPVTTAFTYQGVLANGGAPINGDANVRFTVCNSATVAASISAVATPATKSFTDIVNGQITTSLDFGSAVDTNQALWLNIEVESPPGSGFVTLSPRQPITPTPQARVAQFAINATNAASVPWSGLTGQPAITTGNFGIGTTTPGARMEINASTSDGLLVRTSNSSPWALRIGNDLATAAGFQTGMFVTNDGFFRITNRIANPNGTYAQLGTNGAWTALSDSRLKTDITTAEGNLVAALKLRPVNFRWKADGAADFGLIAQEVREVLPRLVTGNESKDSLTLNYSQLSVVAIGAIQEQQREIERLARDNANLKARLERLEKALETKPAGK